jgi:pimeloyl-ACP methyl ester carboxylesterase
MRVKLPLLQRTARVAPLVGVPIKRIANFDKLSQAPEILDFARRESDRIWSWKISARSAATLFSYEPPLDWSRVQTPVLVLVGEGDEMVTPDFTEAVLREGRPPRAELRVVPGTGHLLFHDHLAEVLPAVVDWIRGTLAPMSAHQAKAKAEAGA